MSKLWLITGMTRHGMALVGVLLILLALLGFGAMGAWGQAPPADTAAGAGRGVVSVVSFGFRPGEIRVRSGQPMNLDLVGPVPRALGAMTGRWSRL